ncbi:MAG: diacylglycerol kinase [Alphaproteobacteria bacterium]|nr:diacylglycerol kinase [Alphaproteobacteria bacterium]MCL2505287.1 diacylglycerol kinase [Alphaproteobacteria bacterium]
MKSPYKGLERILKAFGYSYDGFIAVFKTEAAFRQELLFCFFAAVILVFLPVRGIELAFMSFSLLLILIIELLNSAIEAVIDRIGEEFHSLSKKAKDIGSMLVLLAFINMFLTWGIILYPIYFRG